MSKTKMTVAIELITPEKAGEMLSTMGINRKFKEKHGSKLSRDMANGNFKEGNDTICFNPEGKLINGQHRLQAICDSGVAQEMTIKRNVPDDSVIDRGVGRSTSDTFKMHGYVDEDLCNRECVSIINAYLNTRYPDALFWTDSDKEDFAFNNSESLRFAINASHRGVNHPILKKAGPQAAIFAAHEAGIDEDKLYRFCECVNTGLCNGEKEWAAIILRNFLVSITGIKGGGTSQKAQVSTTEQAIRDFVNGKGRRKPYPTNKHFYIIPESKEIA